MHFAKTAIALFAWGCNCR